jgi:hypothetical protein
MIVGTMVASILLYGFSWFLYDFAVYDRTRIFPIDNKGIMFAVARISKFLSFLAAVAFLALVVSRLLG